MKSAVSFPYQFAMSIGVNTVLRCALKRKSHTAEVLVIHHLNPFSTVSSPTCLVQPQLNLCYPTFELTFRSTLKPSFCKICPSFSLYSLFFFYSLLFPDHLQSLVCPSFFPLLFFMINAGGVFYSKKIDHVFPKQILEHLTSTKSPVVTHESCSKLNSLTIFFFSSSTIYPFSLVMLILFFYF